MKMKNYVIVGLLIVGLLYVYHMFVAQKGTLQGALSGLGINR